MNTDLTTDQKAAVLKVVKHLRSVSRASLFRDDDIVLDADAVFHIDDDGKIHCDVGSYVAMECFGASVDDLKIGGRLTAFRLWSLETGLDGSFYETFCDLDELWDAGYNGNDVTPKMYADALEHFIFNLPVSFSWTPYIQATMGADDEDDDD